jgi:hypothetical protein
MSTRAFPAQTRTVCFSPHTTKRLLGHPVSAYHQTKNKDYTSSSLSQSVITVEFTSRKDMTWSVFLRHYTVWYVANVLKEPQLKGVNPFVGDISSQHIHISLERLDSIPDVDTFDNYYYDYIKQDNVIDLGYYAKDIFPAPVAVQVSLFTYHHLHISSFKTSYLHTSQHHITYHYMYIILTYHLIDAENFPEQATGAVYR